MLHKTKLGILPVHRRQWPWVSLSPSSASCSRASADNGVERSLAGCPFRDCFFELRFDWQSFEQFAMIEEPWRPFCILFGT